MATRATIWIGEETKDVAKRVAVIRETVSEDDGYMHLGEGDFWDYDMDEPWEKYLHTIEDRVVPAPNFSVNMAKADLLRLVVGANVEDLEYQDLDVLVKKSLKGKGQGPFFAQIGSGDRVHHCLFSVGGNRHYFEKLLDALSKKECVTRKTLFGLINQKVAGEFGVIPSSCFTHAGDPKCQR